MIIIRHPKRRYPPLSSAFLTLAILLAMTFDRPVTAEESEASETWETAYHLLLPFGEPTSEKSRVPDRSELPGFSVLPPGPGPWEEVMHSYSVRIFSSTPPKSVKKTKHSLAAIAGAIAGGEKNLNFDQLEHRIRVSTEAGGVFEFVELRRPERLTDVRNCIRFGFTFIDHRELPKMPSPLEMTVEVLDCKHPAAESYHAVLVYSERRPPGSTRMGSDSEMQSFFASLQFSDIPGAPVVDRIPLDDIALQVYADGDTVWSTLPERGSLTHMDASNLETPQELVTGGSPAHLAAGSGVLWVSAANGSISRIDPAVKQRVHELSVGGRPGPITAGGGAVWILDYESQAILRLDPEVNKITKRIALGEGQQKAIARNQARILTFRKPTFSALSDLIFWGGALWVADHGRSRVLKLDPESGERLGEPIPVGNGPMDLLVADDSLWTVNREDGSLSRIDSASGSLVSTIPVCLKPNEGTLGSHWIWVSCFGDGSIVRVDPKSNRVVGDAIPVGGGPYGVATSEDYVWVAGASSRSLARIRLGSLTSPD